MICASIANIVVNNRRSNEQSLDQDIKQRQCFHHLIHPKINSNDDDDIDDYFMK